MREELLEELARVSARVEIGVILEDLAFLDAEAFWWPPDVRRHVLADGLYRRKFFDRLEECRMMADLWIRLKEYFGLPHPHYVRLLIHEVGHHRQTGDASSSGQAR